MDLKLERSNILQVDFISKKGTLKLLPVGKKGKQKLIIGDDSGQVICYEFKKGEPQVVFQIRPFEGPISCVAIGGIGSKLDRIFISQGQKIIGVTKKGKEFFKLQTPLIEEINTITVYETKIYTGCEYIYNLYDDGNEIAYFINRDVINDIIIENITKENDFDTILACQDNCLRIVQGSQVISEIPTTSSTICVATSMNIEKTAKKGQVYLIYGMESGSFGEVRIDAKPDNIISYSYTWLVEDSVKRGAVSCLKVFDLRKTGIADIIVGRDDGRLEVYSRDGSGNRPKLIFTYDIEESIRGVECGLVNSTEYNEIIVAGYSGKLISFTTEPVNQRAQDDNYGRTIQTVNNENRIKYLQKEIDALRAKLDKERALVKKAPTATSMKPPPEFSINAKFLLDPTTAAYLLNIEIQNLIDIVIVRSPVVLDFLETGTSLVSITPPELLTDSSSSEDGAYKFVAAFRGQTADVRRLNVSIRSTEGEFGDVLVTVVTALNPTTKAAKVLRFPLKPLSLHSKIHILNEEQMSRPRNMIKFTGQMPLSVIHEWVQSLFPDIPPRLAEDSIEEKYFFKHTFTESVTICEFKKNELIFESESASTIVIVKENIVRFANARRVHIESALSSNSSSIQSFLSLIRPKLEYQISLARKMDLVDAVQEISMQTDASAVNDTLAWLSPEYVEILKQQDSIRQEFKARAKSLEYLSGIITDLFIDWNRLHSKDARNRIPALHQAILANDFDQLVDIFLVSDGRSSRNIPMDLDMLIAASKDAIGAIIQKPKMTEKLLSKPPFRFLHDTISAVTATTGFGQGLYSETELDSAQITDKDAKISYLQKIFDLVGICKGAALKVSALKVVAGAEPENTNQFLIAFAEVATDSTIDNDEAVRRVLNGEEPGKRSIPYRRAAMSSPPAESKNDDVPISSGAKESRSSAKEIEPSMDINPDRGRSRGGTRGGKPQQASADTGLSRTTALPNLDKEIEKCDGTEVTTQTLLGELITRPKLTEKLLSKPPFRFLFDIVMEVTRSTGFAKYLYNEDEMNSANITEKSQKLNFLEKIIKVVGIQLNTIVVAQPAKIIAGQDAENTNIFLQQLAIAAKFAPESSNAVKTVIDELGGGSPQELVSAIANLNVNLNVNVAAATTASSATRKNDPTSARTEDRRALKQASSEPKDDVYVPTKDATAAADDKNGDNDGDGESKRSARPTTARRRPPKVKEGATEVSAKDSAPVSKKTEGILLDGQGDDDDEDMIADEKRLADDFKPDTRNGPSQTNAQSKLVKDILSLQAEQEAASRAANANDTADDKATEESKSGGIRLRGGLRKAGNDKKTFTGPLAGSGSSAGPSSSLAEGDIERIRSAVQVLVQHTGPLGSCMDYIQEDVGLMTAELHKWEDECRRDEALLATEKLKTKELLQPLQSELSELEDQIKDQVAKISSLKASITKNDDSIQKILKLVASS